MDAVTGAALAVIVAWVSILAVILLPLGRWFDPKRLRIAGALTLGLLAASAFGANVPSYLPLVFLVAGAVVARWTGARGGHEARAR